MQLRVPMDPLKQEPGSFDMCQIVGRVNSGVEGIDRCTIDLGMI
jgi:hypothetical protein